MRRLVYTEPVVTLGPYRAAQSNGYLYGPVYGDLIRFVSAKHRITQDSARAVVETIFRYIDAETVRHGEPMTFPGFARIWRGEDQTSNVSGRSGAVLHISRRNIKNRYTDEEDEEDAGPRE